MFDLHVADNFNYMFEDAYKHGEYATWPEALAAAKHIVDRCLAEYHTPGMKADELYEQYTTFGDDPQISPVPDGERFSGWEYAKLRCAAICG